MLSGIIVVAVGVYLIGLAVVIATKPLLAESFLKSFASSARAHYTEQAVRLIAGTAVVIFAPSMWYPDLFRLFGWVVIVTTVGLLLIPWQWHHRFARWAIPVAIRHVKLLALGALGLGSLMLYGASRSVIS